MPPDCNFSPESLREYAREARFACPKCFRNKPDRELNEWEITKKEFIPQYRLWEPEEKGVKTTPLKSPALYQEGESEIIRYYEKYGIQVGYVRGKGKRTIFSVRPSGPGIGAYCRPPNKEGVYFDLNRLLMDSWEIVHPKYVWNSLVKRIQYAWGKVHEEYVEYALREGKNVPKEVLRDYPDLKRRFEQRG